ncbi:ninein-like protein isoform X3 [Lingula anatina]|uniref:Ninein-like protein isoform X3 n=1 Tax=Lingula anatina TaxID=7574 RepID=A0A1S3JX18_LINAN|nr:ninein-like protein isoform X3 [Lingula anatina]|eukprot:XP_013414596.1 ninein-like protein isoform X3 [Lingula anatina]
MAEDNEYVMQLREVFDSCDHSNTGYLNKAELKELCIKLQLEDQSDAVIRQLLGSDEEGRVGFDEFKEAFVSVLSSAVDALDDASSTEDETSQREDPGETVSPKYVKGSKKYGRRSKPEFDTDYSDTDVSYQSPRNTPRVRLGNRERLSSIDSVESIGNSPTDSKFNKTDDNVLSRPGSKAEMFEAEGQMDQSMSALDPVSEEQHLKAIWRELGVGQMGSLSIHELSTVCEHIGMEEMTDEELSQLFERLDVDQDGQVSFDEFLRGLFQHGGSNLPSTPIRPISSQKQKLKLQMSMSMNIDESLRGQTPSIVAVGSGSGVFSSLDVGNTGYAKPEEITEFWDSLGIKNTTDILQHLEFDTHSKIHLAELSYALEQEIIGMEEDNAVYQAAVATYQQELRHLKSHTEQLTNERDKLKSDVNDALNRSTILVKEADERHMKMEKESETKIKLLEKKYQDQIKQLQSKLEEETEHLTTQARKQKQKLEQELNSMKEEEIKYKDQIAEQQREIEKLEKELGDATEKVMELQKVNFKQQRELDSVAELQERLAELESNRDLMKDEHQKFTQQKLKQVETENKELRDKNDELTMEVETLKQQLSSKKRGKSRKSSEHNKPVRSGSLLSDYTKPVIVKRAGRSSSENSDEDDSMAAGRPRRRLPSKPNTQDMTGSNEEDDKLQTEIDSLKQQQEREVKELQNQLEIEKKEIEQAYKLEITKVEEDFTKEKEDLLKGFTSEKEKAKKEFTKEKLQLAENLEKQLADKFENERQELVIRYGSEKNLLEQKFAKEKNKMTERLKKEFQEDLRAKLHELQEEHERDKLVLRGDLTKDRAEFEEANRQKKELELKMKLQKEEMELEFAREKQKLRENFSQEKRDIEDQHRMEIYDYENIFVLGTDGLKGKIKDDFYALLKKCTAEEVEEERVKLYEDYDKEKEGMKEAFEQEKAAICQAFTAERDELEQTLKKEVTGMRDQFQVERDRLEKQIIRYEEKLESLKRDRDAVEDKLREQIDELEKQGGRNPYDDEEFMEEVKEKLEEEFMGQLERVQNAFDAERDQYDHRISLLEEQLEDMRRHKDVDEENLRKAEELEVRHKNLERAKARAEQQIEDLNQRVDQLLSENSDIRHTLEGRIERLVAEKERLSLSAKEDSLRAAQLASSQEKAEHTTLLGEKNSLEDRCHHLQQELVSLRNKLTSTSAAQAKCEILSTEKQALENRLKELQHQVTLDQLKSMETDKIKERMENWENERNILKGQLQQANDQLLEANTSLSIAESQHIREIQGLKDQAENMVNTAMYNDQKLQLVGAEKKIRELEQALEMRVTEGNKILLDSQASHKRALRETEEEKESTARKLKQTTALLEEQILKYKDQCEKTARAGMLVKDLYVENAQLMKALQITEERQKNSEKQCYKWEEKYVALQRVVNKIVPAALG